MTLQDFQQELLQQAAQAGFSAAEIYVSAGRSLEVRVFDGEIAHYESSRQLGICFRGLYQGKMGYAFSEKLAEPVIPYLLREAAANAEILPDAEIEDLAAGSMPPSDTTFAADLAAVAPGAIIQAARQLETGALTLDPRIRGVEYALAEYSEGERTIANTLGLAVSQRSNLLVAFALARAEAGSSCKKGTEIWQGRDFLELNATTVGRKAAALALERLGARPVASGRYRILLDRQAATDLLRVFVPVFFADKIQQGFSLLGDRLDQIIAAPAVSLTDEAICPASLSQPAFDSEGSPTRRTPLVVAGRLCGILHNRKTARRAAATTTGNGFKPSYRSPVQVAATNCHFEAGVMNQNELMRELAGGLLVTGISGLHAGASLVSGDFSLLAEGFLIDQGQKTQPVEQITIAGNFYQLLRDIEATGNDLWFGLPGGSGQVGSPSLLISGLSVSGQPSGSR